MLKSVVGCIWYILILFDGTVNKKKTTAPNRRGGTEGDNREAEPSIKQVRQIVVRFRLAGSKGQMC